MTVQSIQQIRWRPEWNLENEAVKPTHSLYTSKHGWSWTASSVVFTFPGMLQSLCTQTGFWLATCYSAHLQLHCCVLVYICIISSHQLDCCSCWTGRGANVILFTTGIPTNIIFALIIRCICFLSYLTKDWTCDAWICINESYIGIPYVLQVE